MRYINLHFTLLYFTVVIFDPLPIGHVTCGMHSQRFGLHAYV